MGLLFAFAFEDDNNNDKGLEEEEEDLILQSDTTEPQLPAQEEEEEESVLLKMENYGLGPSTSSVSTLGDVTTIWLKDILQPYYSPSTYETEEFYYEVFSFVSLASCYHIDNDDDDTNTDDNIKAKGLRCTSTLERLDLV